VTRLRGPAHLYDGVDDPDGLLDDAVEPEVVAPHPVREHALVVWGRPLHRGTDGRWYAGRPARPTPMGAGQRARRTPERARPHARAVRTRPRKANAPPDGEGDPPGGAEAEPHLSARVEEVRRLALDALDLLAALQARLDRLEGQR
jgi:hypothetical protein